MEQATCARCGKPFERRQRAHRYCCKECQQRAAGRRRDRRRLSAPAPCDIEGCTKPRRSATAAWCEMHYGRWRRNGDPKLIQEPQPLYANDRGYIKLRLSDHPLADRQGYIYEHRAVVYELAGSGKQPCFWCGVEMEWGRNLHVDHLDHNRGNNDPSNLVISCRQCNTTRKESDKQGRWAHLMAERRVLIKYADEVEAIRTDLMNRLTSHEQRGGWNA